MSEGTTLVSAWTATRRALEGAGLESPVLESRLLVEAATGARRLDIVTDPHRAIEAAALTRLAELLARRLAREPLAHILGRQGFWTLDLAVTPDVLIPRADTEAVVHAGLLLLGDTESARVLDLGVGSGAILLALLTERATASGLGVDASAAALAVAAANAAQAGLGDRARFAQADWTAPDWAGALDGPYDLVVANPPYIETETIATLAPEVALAEPRLALDGGSDGLSAYRHILPGLRSLVKPWGGFALETGRGQAEAVAGLAEAEGLRVDGLFKDLSGVDRVVYGRRVGG